METRDARYRFSDDVRLMTRAIALRMIHAGEVAASPDELGAWIARTEDVRERLTRGGYGSDFDDADLFPLFQGAVARATTTPAAPAGGTGRSPWLWIGLSVFVLVAILLVVWIAS